MVTPMKAAWSKPSTILFASEIPANDRAFNFALAQAREFGATLILFHAYDTLVVQPLRAEGESAALTAALKGSEAYAAYLTEERAIEAEIDALTTTPPPSVERSLPCCRAARSRRRGWLYLMGRRYL